MDGGEFVMLVTLGVFGIVISFIGSSLALAVIRDPSIWWLIVILGLVFGAVMMKMFMNLEGGGN